MLGAEALTRLEGLRHGQKPSQGTPPQGGQPSPLPHQGGVQGQHPLPQPGEEEGGRPSILPRPVQASHRDPIESGQVLQAVTAPGDERLRHLLGVYGEGGEPEPRPLQEGQVDGDVVPHHNGGVPYEGQEPLGHQGERGGVGQVLGGNAREALHLRGKGAIGLDQGG